MAKRRTAVQAVQALESAAAITEAQAFVRRLIEDEELRDAVGRAIESARHVYDRISGTKKVSKLLDDKKLEAEALEAYDAIRTVTVRLTGAGKRLPDPKAKQRKRARTVRTAAILAVGGTGAAVVGSEGLRSKILDTLFGAEEEFVYTPPADPAPSDAPGSPLSAV